jgi:hypothetical protein
VGLAGALMPYYRLYFLDRFSGHIERFDEFEAEHDSAALAEADDRRRSRRTELWRGRTMVARWEASEIPG